MNAVKAFDAMNDVPHSAALSYLVHYLDLWRRPPDGSSCTVFYGSNPEWVDSVDLGAFKEFLTIYCNMTWLSVILILAPSRGLEMRARLAWCVPDPAASCGFLAGFPWPPMGIPIEPLWVSLLNRFGYPH